MEHITRFLNSGFNSDRLLVLEILIGLKIYSQSNFCWSHSTVDVEEIGTYSGSIQIKSKYPITLNIQLLYEYIGRRYKTYFPFVASNFITAHTLPNIINATHKDVHKAKDRLTNMFLDFYFYFRFLICRFCQQRFALTRRAKAFN